MKWGAEKHLQKTTIQKKIIKIHQEIKNQLRLTAMKKNNIAEVKTVKKKSIRSSAKDLKKKSRITLETEDTNSNKKIPKKYD